jgi:glycosyltransferase involved in cell wall biosynthesis
LEWSSRRAPINILFLSPYLVYPGALGGTQRVYQLIRYLAPRHRVCLVHFAEGYELDLTEQAREMEALCERVETFPLKPESVGTRLRHVFSLLPNGVLHYRNSRVQGCVDRLLRECRMDLIHMEYFWMGEYVRSKRTCAVVLAEQELQSRALLDSLRRGSLSPMKARRWLRYWKYRHYERHGTDLFDLILATTEAEKARFRAYRPGLAVEIYPNVVDTGFFCASSPPTPSSLLFVGNFRHAPNVEGLRWFMGNVYPRIRKEAPETELTVVGPSPPRDIRQLGQQKGIDVTGYVQDIRPYLEKSGVFLCPMVTGGGMRGKVLEAMSMSRAVVSTSRGAEGIEAARGREILIGDGPGDFADAVLRLIEETETRVTIGENARRLVVARYSTDVVFPFVEGLYSHIIQGI